MSMTDPLGDMLTRIRNGQQARKDTEKGPLRNKLTLIKRAAPLALAEPGQPLN